MGNIVEDCLRQVNADFVGIGKGALLLAVDGLEHFRDKVINPAGKKQFSFLPAVDHCLKITGDRCLILHNFSEGQMKGAVSNTDGNDGSLALHDQLVADIWRYENNVILFQLPFSKTGEVDGISSQYTL